MLYTVDTLINELQKFDKDLEVNINLNGALYNRDISVEKRKLYDKEIVLISRKF